MDYIVAPVPMANAPEIDEMIPQFRVYPNPVTQELTLEMNGHSQELQKGLKLSLFDAKGIKADLHWVWTGSGQLEIDCANLIPGIYILAIEGGRKVFYHRVSKL
ncbi:MAG TPA: T9SS type A sorting domain-containing protein [Bacteroidetes bacterium]|nr:T9SS type A sorting domain-containing protein [Bacteroidota bacterium]